jgi:hypothetical protein
MDLRFESLIMNALRCAFLTPSPSAKVLNFANGSATFPSPEGESKSEFDKKAIRLSRFYLVLVPVRFTFTSGSHLILDDESVVCSPGAAE